MGIYKSQEKEALAEFKQYLKEATDMDEAMYAWTFYNKHLYIDDLNTYLRLKINKVIETGYGNYNSNIVIVLKSLEDKRYINFFKSLFANLHMDYNNFYFTSYNKHVVNYTQVYDEVINLELKAIAPEVVFTVGEYNIQENGFKVISLDKENFDKMLELSSKENLSEEETQELSDRKKAVWSQLKYIVKYYIN